MDNPKDLFDKGTKLISNCAWAQGFALLNKAGEMNYDPANRLLGELALKAYQLRCLYILRKIDLSGVNLPGNIEVYMKSQ